MERSVNSYDSFLVQGRRVRALRVILALLILFMAVPSSRGWASPPPVPSSPRPIPLDEIAARLPHTDASGTVVTTSGLPVAGADVFLYFESSTDAGFRDCLAGRVKTDARGKFIFKKAVVWESRPPTHANYEGLRRYDVIARHPGLGIAFTALLEGGHADQLKITMTKPAYEEIQVTYNHGDPMEGVRVFLARGSDIQKRDSFRLRSDIGLSGALTDKQGHARLLSMPEGSFECLKDGFYPVEPESHQMRPGGQLSGRVTDPEGKPVAGAAVWFEYKGDIMFGADRMIVTFTDRAGRYQLENLPESAVVKPFERLVNGGRGIGVSIHPAPVYLRAQDFRANSDLTCVPQQFMMRPAEKLTRDIRMIHGCVLAGQVVDAVTSRPMPRIVLDTTDHTSHPLNITTDGMGRFRIVYPPGAPAQLTWAWQTIYHNDYILNEDQRDQTAFEGVMDKSHTGLVLKVGVRPVKALQGDVPRPEGKP